MSGIFMEKGQNKTDVLGLFEVFSSQNGCTERVITLLEPAYF